MTKRSNDITKFFFIFDNEASEVLTSYDHDIKNIHWSYVDFDGVQECLDEIRPSARFASRLEAKKAVHVLYKGLKKLGTSDDEMDFMIYKAKSQIVQTTYWKLSE